jgi:hypothetical protein
VFLLPAVLWASHQSLSAQLHCLLIAALHYAELAAMLLFSHLSGAGVLGFGKTSLCQLVCQLHDGNQLLFANPTGLMHQPADGFGYLFFMRP